MKKVTLEPEFPPAKITIEEEIYIALKAGPLTPVGLTDKTSRKSGGNVSAATKQLLLKKIIKKRRCECGMHDIYEIVKQK